MDSDGDGLPDSEEIDIYGTNHSNADTDGDGLNDGDEVLTHQTDPLVADTDGDGLNDGDEVITYQTDPLVADTDEDGLIDGSEVVDGTNPLQKEPTTSPTKVRRYSGHLTGVNAMIVDCLLATHLICL